MVQLAFDQTGSGPLLVLVHGITENRHSWDPLLDRLAATTEYSASTCADTVTRQQPIPTT